MSSRTTGARRRSRRARRGGPLAGVMLNLRTAGWLGGRLWRPALSETRRHVRRRGRRRRRR